MNNNSNFSVLVGDVFRLKNNGTYSVWKVIGSHIGTATQNHLVELVSVDSDFPMVYGHRPESILVPFCMLQCFGIERV